MVNAERASYSAPNFARMQERTRSQMLEDLVANLQNHAETGQIPKPYRRGSWRPIGHMRPSSPLLDSVRDLFEGQDQMARDFARAFRLPQLDAAAASAALTGPVPRPFGVRVSGQQFEAQQGRRFRMPQAGEGPYGAHAGRAAGVGK